MISFSDMLQLIFLTSRVSDGSPWPSTQGGEGAIYTYLARSDFIARYWSVEFQPRKRGRTCRNCGVAGLSRDQTSHWSTFIAFIIIIIT